MGIDTQGDGNPPDPETPDTLGRAAFATPRDQLHAHQVGIQGLLQEDPAIFVALGELAVRGLRDPAIQQILDARE